MKISPILLYLYFDINSLCSGAEGDQTYRGDYQVVVLVYVQLN